MIVPAVLALREAVLSNHHTLQDTQSNDSDHIHVVEAVVANLQSLQLLESGQIQLSEAQIAHILVNNDLRYARVKREEITDTAHSGVRVGMREIGVVRQHADVYSSGTHTTPS